MFYKFLSFITVMVWFSAAEAASMPTTTIGMPEYDASGRVVTLNNMGWMHPSIDPITQQFLDQCQDNQGSKVLEIGAAYGYASEAALNNGAEVWVNDLDKRHLQIFKSNIKDKELHSKIHLVPGNFPEGIKLKGESFDAILAVRVLHFFEPKKLEQAAVDMNKALKKGGKVYVVAETPYLKNWSKFIPVYESRKAAGEPYPGYIRGLADYNQTSIKYLPEQVHFLDPDVLTRVFTNAGFEVREATFLDRQDYPDNMRLDGRESVGLIAVKL